MISNDGMHHSISNLAFCVPAVRAIFGYRISKGPRLRLIISMARTESHLNRHALDKPLLVEESEIKLSLHTFLTILILPLLSRFVNRFFVLEII